MTATIAQIFPLIVNGTQHRRRDIAGLSVVDVQSGYVHNLLEQLLASQTPGIATEEDAHSLPDLNGAFGSVPRTILQLYGRASAEHGIMSVFLQTAYITDHRLNACLRGDSRHGLFQSADGSIISEVISHNHTLLPLGKFFSDRERRIFFVPDDNLLEIGYEMSDMQPLMRRAALRVIPQDAAQKPTTLRQFIENAGRPFQDIGLLSRAARQEMRR